MSQTALGGLVSSDWRPGTPSSVQQNACSVHCPPWLGNALLRWGVSDTWCRPSHPGAATPRAGGAGSDWRACRAARGGWGWQGGPV